MLVSPDYKIAVIYKPLPNFLGYGGYLERAIEQICKTQHFVPGEEVEGFDEYWYIDDGPTEYMDPMFRPATYFALDLVLPNLWFLQSPEVYLERMRNFDCAVVNNTSAMNYCKENNLQAKMSGFAADLWYHHPWDFPRDRDWIAVWHNCGDRVAACEAAMQRFPGGQVLWAGDELYAIYLSRGKCALNWLRGNMINMRVFEVMAVGTPLITTRHEDMALYGFIENEHYLGFTGIDEMLEKISWVQNNQELASNIANKARGLVYYNHTYYNRVMEILSIDKRIGD
jgi:hypothetical protein